MASRTRNGPTRDSWTTRAKKTLSFYARGDGQSYTVVIMGPALDAIPAMFPFVAGADWQAVSIPLQGLSSVDMKRVKLISIGIDDTGTVPLSDRRRAPGLRQS